MWWDRARGISSSLSFSPEKIRNSHLHQATRRRCDGVPWRTSFFWERHMEKTWKKTNLFSKHQRCLGVSSGIHFFLVKLKKVYENWSQPESDLDHRKKTSQKSQSYLHNSSNVDVSDDISTSLSGYCRNLKTHHAEAAEGQDCAGPFVSFVQPKGKRGLMSGT